MNLQITTPESDDDWNKYFKLRFEVLRKPWGQPEGSEKDDQEEESFHFMVKDGAQAAGVCRLQVNADGTGQIRYMAVYDKYQGQGIGRLLLTVAEKKAQELGVKKMILHARENAIPFYQTMNYSAVAPSYLLFNSIQHTLMEKILDRV